MNADESKLIARITILAMEISKSGKYHVFAEYMGHIDTFSVNVLPGDQVYAADADFFTLTMKLRGARHDNA